MWPFSKKTSSNLDLPPLKAPVPSLSKDIELIPNDLQEIPDELPQLEEKTKITVPEKLALTQEEPPVIQAPAPKKSAANDVFIKTEIHKKIISKINEIGFDFDRMNDEIEKIVDIKTSRYEKIDDLQSILEDVSKKLMIIDQSLFGG